jgi:uncharacterized phage-associated protein
MAYTPLALANTFLKRHGDEGGIEHMKLQKLCFYAYGWWLVDHDKPLLVEGPEVWKFGPVFSSLYSVLAMYGRQPISKPQKMAFGNVKLIQSDDKDARNLVDMVWERYGERSSFDLSNETHKEGTPWQIEAAKHGYKVPMHHRIPDKLIRNYFVREAQKLSRA